MTDRIIPVARVMRASDLDRKTIMRALRGLPIRPSSMRRLVRAYQLLGIPVPPEWQR